MITITNGQITLTVPKSAYHTSYESAGFRPVESVVSSESRLDSYPSTKVNARGEEMDDEQKEDFENSEDTEEEETIDLSEIPLGEMDFYQLCDYADQLGLDHSGIRSKKELRALIRNNL